MEASGMIAVARGRHVIFGTGPVGVALAHALVQSGRTVISIPVNEYGSDPVDSTVMRGDPTDFEFALRACVGAEVIYTCLNGPPSQWKAMFPPVIDTVIKVAAETGAKLVHWDLAHMYGPTREPITEATPNSAKTGSASVLIDIADKIINATWTGRIDGVIGRSPDVFGPGAIGAEFGSSFGGRVFWPALEDTELSIVGDIEAPRSLAFIDDVASGLVMLGEAPDSAGFVWHLPCAPPISPSEMASLVVAQAHSSAEVGSSPRHVRGCALLHLKIVRADINEVQHELHTLDRPFVLNHSNFTAAYGENVTSHEDAIRRTLVWFSAHPRPIGTPVSERIGERLPRVVATSRLARRLGSGALAMARTSI
jgi:nucleoside-diphosphate-sugar epimerase